MPSSPLPNQSHVNPATVSSPGCYRSVPTDSGALAKLTSRRVAAFGGGGVSNPLRRL